ncbi:MAG TPA: phosphoribosyltransferase family protein [Ideonella sp.]|uniref:phosphoribosyltransferase n=1 Tax=Ideonella sp. TaxID=1929293 RepID=UPI002E346219|nr:phosphoribosyltransferase family protein [Ideonella sp.]HEX5687390.1 phosphoribosyltransferase family protein [Ideonella sp.]
MEWLFEDRVDAGRRLARALLQRGIADPVVLALPRGGVPVAAEVAKALKAPLDLLLVRKIGAPDQPELAVAAVADGAEPALAIDEQTLALCGTSLEYVTGELPAHIKEIERRRALYLKGRPPVPVDGKTVVLVDDGIATGTTVRAAIRALRQRHPARVVLAVPVAPATEVQALRAEVDDLVCLETLDWFGAVGAHYRHFGQTSDEEVVALLKERS